MGDTDNILSAANARNLIISFFSDIEKRQSLFKQIVETLTEKDDDFFYISNSHDKLEAFEDCIVHGHFQWILDVTDNQIQTEFDSKYTTDCSVSHKTFINFYEIFDQKISSSKEFSERAERLLQKYSKFLTK